MKISVIFLNPITSITITITRATPAYIHIFAAPNTSIAISDAKNIDCRTYRII